ncbi:hypothetical protein HK405_009018, partial [Cladochytrium tenue]
MAAVGRGDDDDDDEAAAELGSNAAIVRVDSLGSPLVSAMRTAGGPPRSARSREGSNVSFRLAAGTTQPPPPMLPPTPRRASAQVAENDGDGDEAGTVSADGRIGYRAQKGNEPSAAGRARDEGKGVGDVPASGVVASAPLTPAEVPGTAGSGRMGGSVIAVAAAVKATLTQEESDEPRFERRVAPERQPRDSLTVPTLEEAAARAVAAAAARAPPAAAAKTNGVPAMPKGAEEKDWPPPPVGRRMSMFSGGLPMGGGGGSRRGSVSGSLEARRVHPLVKMLREWVQHVLEQPVTRAVLRVLGDHRAEILWWYLVMFLAHLAITVFLVLSLTIVMPGIWVYNFVQLYVILLVAVSLVAARKISYHVRVSMTASDLLRGTARMGELADFWVNGKLSPGHTTALASGVVEHLAEILVIGCSILYSWEARESPLMEGNCIPPNYAGASLPEGISIPDYMQGSVTLAEVYNFGLPLADGLVAGWAAAAVDLLDFTMSVDLDTVFYSISLSVGIILSGITGYRLVTRNTFFDRTCFAACFIYVVKACVALIYYKVLWLNPGARYVLLYTLLNASTAILYYLYETRLSVFFSSETNAKRFRLLIYVELFLYAVITIILDVSFFAGASNTASGGYTTSGPVEFPIKVANYTMDMVIGVTIFSATIFSLSKIIRENREELAGLSRGSLYHIILMSDVTKFAFVLAIEVYKAATSFDPTNSIGVLPVANNSFQHVIDVTKITILVLNLILPSGIAKIVSSAKTGSGGSGGGNTANGAGGL